VAPSTANTSSAASVAASSLETLPPTSGFAITSPASNQIVGPSVTVEGTAEVRAGSELWLAVRPLQDERFYLQGTAPLSVVGGAWRAALSLGDGTANGERLLIVVVQVDGSDGDVLRSSLVDGATGGIELPAGAEKVAAVMVVLDA
jgi:hypothetical protein